MKFKRTLTLLVALLLVTATVLGSCSKSGKKPDETTPAVTQIPEQPINPEPDPFVVIAENGVSDYQIVTVEKPSEMEAYAAEIIAAAIKEKGDATVTVVTDKASAAEHEILIGNTNRELSKTAAVGLTALDYAVLVQNGSVALTGANVYHTYVAADWFVREGLVGGDEADGGAKIAKIANQNYVFDYEVMDPEADETKVGTLAEIYKSIADPNGRLMYCAHRGDHVKYPANALEGVISAFENARADMVEIDLQKTKDGYWVLCHDTTLTNTTDCNKFIGKNGWPADAYVSSWTLEQIRKLKLEGSKHTMPTFEEILDGARGKVLLVLDKVVSAGGLSACEELYEIAWKHCAAETLVFQCYSINALPDSFFQKMYNETGIRLVKHIIATDLNFLKNYKELDYMIQTLQVGFTTDEQFLNNELLPAAKGKCRLWLNTLGGNGGDAKKMDDDVESTWQALYEAGYSMIQTDQPYKMKDFVDKTLTGNIKRYAEIVKVYDAEVIGSVDGFTIPTTVKAVNSNGRELTDNVTWQDVKASYEPGVYEINGKTASGFDVKLTLTIRERPVIRTAEDWANLAKEIADGTSYAGIKIYIDADIDFGGAQIQPIGTTAHPFCGIIYGQNHTFSNMVFKTTSADPAGLIGMANTFEINDLHLKNVKSSSENIAVGALIGSATSGTVKNCTVENAEITGTSGSMGGKSGFIGYANGCTVSDCTVKGVKLTGGRDCGGMFGDIVSSKITNCTATDVDVNATGNSVGAFTGNNHGSTCTNCHVVGKVVTKGSNFGAFVGYSGNTPTYNDCSCEVENKSLPAVGKVAATAKGNEIIVK